MAFNPTNPNGQATMAASAPVVIASNQSAIPTYISSGLSATTGSITSATSTITLASLVGVGSVTVTFSGTHAGVNASFEAFDGTNWIAIVSQGGANSLAPSSTVTGVLTTNGTTAWNISPFFGYTQFRVRATAWTSGSASVVILPSAQATQTMVNVATLPSVNLGTGGVAATSLGKAEDAVHTSGDTGVAVWGVRNDNAATVLTSATGDYSGLAVDGTGTVYTKEAPANTATKTNVIAAITSTTILAANAARRSAIIFNDSNSDCYLSYGGTASNTSFTVYLRAFDTVTVNGSEYAGALVGIWVTATGNARVTEII